MAKTILLFLLHTEFEKKKTRLFGAVKREKKIDHSHCTSIAHNQSVHWCTKKQTGQPKKTTTCNDRNIVITGLFISEGNRIFGKAVGM